MMSKLRWWSERSWHYLMIESQSVFERINSVIMLVFIFVKSFSLSPLNFGKSQLLRFFFRIFLKVYGIVNLPDDFVDDLLDVA